MSAAKALLVGLYSHVGFHHRCAENEIELVVLKFVIKSAERAAAAMISGRCLECFVDGYCINIVHYFVSPCYLYLKKLGFCDKI
jgi:hypothetical protein